MVNLRLSAGAIVVFLALLCLVPGNVYAIPETFNISFDEGGDGTIDWTGTYTVDGGVLTAFNAVIGNCANPGACTYNVITFLNDDPDNNNNLPSLIVASPFGLLALFDNLLPTANSWATFNPFDPGSFFGWRGGAYDTVAVPEPSTLLLLGTGLLVVAYIARRRRQPRE